MDVLIVPFGTGFPFFMSSSGALAALEVPSGVLAVATVALEVHVVLVALLNSKVFNPCAEDLHKLPEVLGVHPEIALHV